ncbi:GNAT family N-acetyltransferase [Actinacidiphila alni]|uniref:GNAT family N-acetyltransferase n=1 Tax=Actinacidiphila alni TaxID=380248 RepID=UPI0033ED3265
MAIDYSWRSAFDNAALNALHAEGFGGPAADTDWLSRVRRHSLGWVCASDGARLVGFVNVVWDGGSHAFLLDTVVASDLRRSGVGAALVAEAVRRSRAAGCEWMHVDFEEELRPFYVDGCGFRPTAAGLIAL